MIIKIEIKDIKEWDGAINKTLTIVASKDHDNAVHLDLNGSEADYDIEELINALICFQK